MGGRFRSVLPSDLRFVVSAQCLARFSLSPTAPHVENHLSPPTALPQGALARESLPASGSAYATDLQRAELRMLFRRYGAGLGGELSMRACVSTQREVTRVHSRQGGGQREASAPVRCVSSAVGCHHCGTRRGRVIADHQPPNKTVYGAARL